ncbi:MAG: hypothetical protein R6X25_09075 [Candidatus Krumholzibacteriia bacterium]
MRYIIPASMVLAAGLLLAVPGCGGEQDDAYTEEELEQDRTQPAVDQERTQVLNEMEREYARLDERIGELSRQIEVAGEAAGAEFQTALRDTLNDLREQQRQAGERLARLADAGEQEWERARLDAQHSLQDLEQAVDHAWQAVEAR